MASLAVSAYLISAAQAPETSEPSSAGAGTNAGSGRPVDLTVMARWELEKTDPTTAATVPMTTVAVTAAPQPQPQPPAPQDSCGQAIAAVEARGLTPAAGYEIVCPGNAAGHEGMTCWNVAGLCEGRKEIVIHLVDAFVVANEFENSRIFSGSPARCHTIDCGGAAYGF